MAFGGTGNNVGSTNSKTANQTSIATAYANSPSAGNLVVATIATDNASTITGDEGAVTSVSDDAGNTYTKALEFNITQGSAQAGAVCSVWYCVLTSSVTGSNTLTANFSNSTSRDASCLIMNVWTLDANSTVSVAASNGVNGTGDPTSQDLTTTNAEHLRLRMIAGETNSTTALTPTTNWNAVQSTQTSGGGAASNMAVRGEWRIFTGTSAASDPTWVTSDHANVLVAFLEVSGTPKSRPFRGVSNRFFMRRF